METEGAFGCSWAGWFGGGDGEEVGAVTLSRMMAGRASGVLGWHFDVAHL